MADTLNNTIKVTAATLVMSLYGITAFSQYYYKDLMSTRQTNETFRLYKANNVGSVALNSFQGNQPVTEGFICEQKVNLARNQVTTYTKNTGAEASFFTAYYNLQGLLVRSVDSTTESVSTSSYSYDANNRLLLLTHQSRANDNSSAITESHRWQYSGNGSPASMLRLVNGNDSTVVGFVTDNKGNVTEEAPVHKGVSQASTFYYYDEKNRLTDIVRYNAKARRLLPEYIFEYENDGELSTMMLVPEGSADYQKWYYKYNEGGLKAVDFCYDKKGVLLGKVEYNYSGR